MGKHAPKQPERRPIRRRRPPERIDRLQPLSSTSETPREATRRRREASRMVDPRVRQRRRRRRLTVTLSVLVLLVVGTAVAVFAWARNVESGLNRVVNTDPELLKALEPGSNAKPGEPFYMVITGTDTRPEERVARSDTLLVARIDPTSQRVQMMSIPRDTRANIPGRGMEKINGAMQYGGPALVIKTVKEFTGLPITHYVNLDFSGFKDIVNSVGGVDIFVPEEIDDLQAADNHPSARYIPKGWQTLDGMHALTFVRARHQFADQDFSRMRNQQAFLKALVKKASAIKNPAQLVGLVNAVSKAVDTDLKLADIYALARDFRGMPDANLETITMPGSAKFIDGLSFVVADEAAMDKVIQRMEKGQPLSGKSTVPTSTVSPGGTNSANTNKPVTVKPSEITVTIRNGAGVSGIAKSVSDRLSPQGFKIIETGNMNQFVYDKTLVVYKTDTVKAAMVREALGLGDVVASRSMYSFKTDILIVVGKDWDPAKAGQAASPRD
jgi:LCP family protein required for cell wall assembly